VSTSGGSSGGAKNPYTLTAVAGATHTATSWQYCLVTSSGGIFSAPNCVITAPAAPAKGDAFVVNQVGGLGVGGVTSVVPNAGQTIGFDDGTGASGVLLFNQGDSLASTTTTFRYDGVSNWIIESTAGTDANAGTFQGNGASWEIWNTADGVSMYQISTTGVEANIPIEANEGVLFLFRSFTGTDVPTSADYMLFNNAGGSQTSEPILTGTSAIGTGQTLLYANKGAGKITITPTSANIDGNSSLVVPPHASVAVYTDGLNFYTFGTLAKASNTSATATASTPAPTTGSAFVPAANQDCELSFVVTTASTFTVTYGPTTGAEHTIISGVALPIGTFFNKRIPAGWSVIITGTIADLGSILAVTC